MKDFRDMTQADVSAYNARVAKRVNSAMAMLAQATGEPTPDGEEDKLHAEIIKHCNAQWPRWKYLHGSMAHKTRRTTGEPDFIVLANWGRTFLFECKTKSTKPTPAQRDFAHEAKKVGHTVHVIRSMREFLEVVR